MTLAIDARRPRLQEAEAGAEIHRPPPPTTLTLIVARAAPPAMRTTITLPRPWTHRHHQRPVTLVELDLLDHHSTQPEQLLPYPKWAHAATVPFTSVLTVRSRNRKTRGVRTPCPVVGRPCRPDLVANQSGPAGRCQAPQTTLQTATSARVVRQPPRQRLTRWPAGELPRHGPHLTHGTCRGAAFRPGSRARERGDQARTAGADRWCGQGWVGARSGVPGP